MSLQFRIRGPNIQPGDGRDIFSIPAGVSEIGRIPTTRDESGFGPECALPADYVSRHHARIEYINTECWITDLGSAHGTTIDGRALEPHQRTKVTPGDVIAIARNFYLTLEVLPDEPLEPMPSPLLPVHQLPKRKPHIRPYQGEIPPALSLASLKLLFFLPEIYFNDYMVLPAGTFSRSNNGSSLRRLSPLDGSGGNNGANGNQLTGSPGFYRPPLRRGQDERETAFISRYLALIESVWMPIEWTGTNFDLFLQARTAPDEFVRWLLSWFDQIYDPSWTPKQLRTMLSITHRLHARRGTRWALRWALWIYTGKEPTIEDSDEDLPPDTFHIRLNAPPNTVSERSVRALIDAYRPAHTFYEIIDF